MATVERKYGGQESIKSKILKFVESNKDVRRKDILRFLVDRIYGEGTYDKNPKVYRGFYSCAFSSYSGNDYLYTGNNRLIKRGCLLLCC